jgi:hypothetical protein
VIRAARYAGVPPWELAQKPSYWLSRLLEAESAERWANAKHGHPTPL